MADRVPPSWRDGGATGLSGADVGNHHDKFLRRHSPVRLYRLSPSSAEYHCRNGLPGDAGQLCQTTCAR